MAESRGIVIAAAAIGAAGAIVAALITVFANSDGGSDGGGGQPTIVGPGQASAFLSRDSGPGGTTVKVSGTGFAAGEGVVLTFHTEQIGSTTANGEGKFENVTVTIPTSFSVFAPQQFDVIARGETSLRAGRAPFTISG